MTTDDTIEDNIPSILDDFIEHVDNMLAKQGLPPTHKERLFYIHALLDNMVTPGYITSWLEQQDRIIS